MKHKLHALIGGFFASLCALPACATLDSPTWQPAILTAPAHSQITQTLQTALSRAAVTIAPDSLTQNPRLILELAPQRSLYGERIGRRMDRPDHFTLEVSGQNCRLRHEQTDETYPLTGVSCQPYSE